MTGQEPGRAGGLAKLAGTGTRTVPKSLKKEHSPVTHFRLPTRRLQENKCVLSEATEASDNSLRPP